MSFGSGCTARRRMNFEKKESEVYEVPGTVLYGRTRYPGTVLYRIFVEEEMCLFFLSTLPFF